MNQPAALSLLPYRGRLVALATRHGKERVLARPLRHGLGASLLHLPEIDTDRLGSFCGTVARTGTAMDACLAKARIAQEQGRTGLAIASEGSFGPHPAVPLLAVGVECLLFLDAERGLTIQEQLLARRTNHSQFRLAAAGGPSSGASLEGWLQQVGFPSHGLLVRPLGSGSGGFQASEMPGDGGGNAPGPLIKDIQDPAALQAAIAWAAALSPQGGVQLETDMRAHRNPTRMASIRQLAFRLVRRIATPCPGCGSPGWGSVGSEEGLPCGWCGSPTALVRLEVLGCPACGLRRGRPRADGLLRADPQHCQHCNP